MYSARAIQPGDLEAVGHELKRTAIVRAIDRAGELQAIAGFYVQEGRAVVFSAIKPEARQQPGFRRALLHFGRALVKEANDLGYQVLAGADPETPNAARLLEHLGFRQAYREIYLWDQQHSH